MYAGMREQTEHSKINNNNIAIVRNNKELFKRMYEVCIYWNRKLGKLYVKSRMIVQYKCQDSCVLRTKVWENVVLLTVDIFKISVWREEMGLGK